MAEITYYKSATEAGGAIGDQLTDGGTDDLLPPILSQNRLSGLEYFRKIWYKSDADMNVMCSVANEGQYDSCFFESADPSDTVSDLTGSETRYGALSIVSNTENTVTVTNDTRWTLMRVGDKAHIGDQMVEIDTITDNGDGTSTVDFHNDIPTADHSGTYFVTCIDKAFNAGDEIPFWIQVVVPELAPANSSLDTHQFFALH